MTTFRVILTQTVEYDFEVEARTFWAAVDLAEQRYKAGNLPSGDLDHRTVVACRTCGETLDGDMSGVDALPGYCGPCSIPEQQDRERGRSEERSPTRCPDCGEEGERRGHQTCQYPTDEEAR